MLLRVLGWLQGASVRLPPHQHGASGHPFPGRSLPPCTSCACFCTHFGALGRTMPGRALVSCVMPGLRLNYRELSSWPGVIFHKEWFFPSPELRKLFPRALLDPCVPRHTRCCGPSGTCCLLAAQAGKSCPVKQASWASHRCRHSGYLHERNQIRSLGRNH